MVLAAAAVGIALVCAASPCLAANPVYVRIAVPPKTTVYVEFQDRDMRMATTVAGLKAATPIRAESVEGGQIHFPEVALPLTAKSLPAGYTEVRAWLNLGPSDVVILDADLQGVADRLIPGSPAPPMRWEVSGYLCPRCVDKQKAVWTYWFEVGAEASTTADTAPILRVPEMTKLKVKVVAQADKRDLRIGVRATVGNAELSDIRTTRGGQESPYSPVQVAVRDAAGKSVAAERGRLDKFGFG